MKDLTLDQATTKCHGLEAAKKSRQDIQETPEVNTFQTRTPATCSGICPGCGQRFHEGGRKKCPTFNQTCCSCRRLGHFARVCLRKHSAAGQYRKPATPHAQALSTNELPVVQLSELAHGPATPAPTVNMQVSTRHGQASLNIFPDSGAEISAAGPQFVKALQEYMDNLAPSNILPRAVNGSILHPVGKLPHVAFCVNSRTVHDDVHIYDSITGALISWAIAKQLGILPECYPEPARQIHAMHTHHNISNLLLTSDQIMAEFPSVFDGQIHTMPGK